MGRKNYTPRYLAQQHRRPNFPKGHRRLAALRFGRQSPGMIITLFPHQHFSRATR
jgi:hypothetical protein